MKMIVITKLPFDSPTFPVTGSQELVAFSLDETFPPENFMHSEVNTFYKVTKHEIGSLLILLTKKWSSLSLVFKNGLHGLVFQREFPNQLFAQSW